MNGAETLKNAADAWSTILKGLLAKIQSRDVKTSLYTKNEGVESDTVVYGCMVISGDHKFYIECFYPPGNNPLELRLLIITKKGNRISSFLNHLFRGHPFARVAKFDINNLAGEGYKITLLGDLPAICEEIYTLVE